MTSSSGRNGDDVISGPGKKLNSVKTMLDTTKFTITDEYETAYGLSEHTTFMLLWQR